MNWNEYKKLALRTESIPVNYFVRLPLPSQDDTIDWGAVAADTNKKATRVLHASLGLATEVIELAFHTNRVNLLEEYGDCFWYLAILDDELGFWPFAAAWCAWEFPEKEAAYWVGEVADCTKRWIYYGKELETPRLRDAAYNLAAALTWELTAAGLVLGEVFEANIRKLEKRYPDLRFESNAAIHRDVDRELDHIDVDGRVIPRVVGEEK